MSKKVLIVEPSLAVRGIAESLLRQNGYEVIAADTVGAARDILRDSQVDLLMVASDLNDDSGNPYYETLGADSATAMLPLLILHDSTGGDLAYPPEAVISKPFTPRDFLDAVSVFGGGIKSEGEATPFGDQDLEDALIDSALGLDKIEVDDTEVLDDDSAITGKPGKNKVESMIGYDYKVQEDDTAKTAHKKIDAINLPPEQAPQAKQPETPPPAPEPSEDSDVLEKIVEPPINKKHQLSESSKIEIITDQYGISIPEESLEFHDNAGTGGMHDYDWFLKELQREGKPEDGSPAAKDGKPEKAPAPKPAPAPPTSAPKAPAGSHSEAVDKFIDEFKKEMEKITGDAAGNIEVTNVSPDQSRASAPVENTSGPGGLDWDEGLERITPAKIRGISRQLIEIMAQQIAEKIVARLDDDIVYHMIKETVDNILQRHAEESARQSK
jgi:CheY-like chemotaxis protein